MNRDLFNTSPIVKNNAGGNAYELSKEQTLAQLAVTGCFNDTFYVKAETQLGEILDACNGVSNTFIAQTAIYARQNGYMKDIPAFLCAVLATRDLDLFEIVFNKVIDNGKMLRNFMKIIRSGVVGRKSFGTAVRRVIREWLQRRKDEDLFKDMVGNDPSMKDIVKMIHPRPRNDARSAFYAWILDKEYDSKNLPAIVQKYEAFKSGQTNDLTGIPFQMLPVAKFSQLDWKNFIATTSWQTLRMNLNTLFRHKAFEFEAEVKAAAEKLSNPELIKRARCFPYQLLAAYLNVEDELPEQLKLALQDALEVATENVPIFGGTVAVCVDISGSMSSSVTGYRPGASSKVTCVEVAGLFATSVLRKNPLAKIILFNDCAQRLHLNPRDSIMTNAQEISSRLSGGTNCSSAMEYLVKQGCKEDTIIYVSDNESWVDTSGSYYVKPRMHKLWLDYRNQNPKAKLVCIDITPNTTTQVKSTKDVLNIGGFSDNVFEVIKNFIENRIDFVQEIKKIQC